jgi:hypothetical protein
MKNLIFLIMIISAAIIGCKQEKNSLEGTWRMVSIDSIQFPDTSFQGMIKNSQIKTWSKEYFTYVGHNQQDTISYDLYGGGRYKLEGNKYDEYIVYSFYKPLINSKFKAILEIRNDTLYQKMNSDSSDSYELRKGYTTEVYVRLK